MKRKPNLATLLKQANRIHRDWGVKPETRQQFLRRLRALNKIRRDYRLPPFSARELLDHILDRAG